MGTWVWLWGVLEGAGFAGDSSNVLSIWFRIRGVIRFLEFHNRCGFILFGFEGEKGQLVRGIVGLAGVRLEFPQSDSRDWVWGQEWGFSLMMVLTGWWILCVDWLGFRVSGMGLYGIWGGLGSWPGFLLWTIGIRLGFVKGFRCRDRWGKWNR